MKFLATVTVASAVAAVASAQLLVANPTLGVSWTTGQQSYVSWTQDCSSMGNASHAVTVNLVHGATPATQTFVAPLGTIDCSTTTGGMTYVNVPNTVPTGPYSLQIMTLPSNSYSPTFTVNNPTLAATTTNAPAPAATTTTAPSGGKGNGANTLGGASLLALAGSMTAAVAALLL